MSLSVSYGIKFGNLLYFLQFSRHVMRIELTKLLLRLPFINRRSVQPQRYTEVEVVPYSLRA